MNDKCSKLTKRACRLSDQCELVKSGLCTDRALLKSARSNLKANKDEIISIPNKLQAEMDEMVTGGDTLDSMEAKIQRINDRYNARMTKVKRRYSDLLKVKNDLKKTISVRTNELKTLESEMQKKVATINNVLKKLQEWDEEIKGKILSITESIDRVKEQGRKDIIKAKAEILEGKDGVMTLKEQLQEVVASGRTDRATKQEMLADLIRQQANIRGQIDDITSYNNRVVAMNHVKERTHQDHIQRLVHDLQRITAKKEEVTKAQASTLAIMRKNIEKMEGDKKEARSELDKITKNFKEALQVLTDTYDKLSKEYVILNQKLSMVNKDKVEQANELSLKISKINEDIANKKEQINKAYRTMDEVTRHTDEAIKGFNRTNKQLSGKLREITEKLKLAKDEQKKKLTKLKYEVDSKTMARDEAVKAYGELDKEYKRKVSNMMGEISDLKYKIKDVSDNITTAKQEGDEKADELITKLNVMKADHAAKLAELSNLQSQKLTAEQQLKMTMDDNDIKMREMQQQIAHITESLLNIASKREAITKIQEAVQTKLDDLIEKKKQATKLTAEETERARVSMIEMQKKSKDIVKDLRVMDAKRDITMKLQASLQAKLDNLIEKKRVALDITERTRIDGGNSISELQRQSDDITQELQSIEDQRIDMEKNQKQKLATINMDIKRKRITRDVSDAKLTQMTREYKEMVEQLNVGQSKLEQEHTEIRKQLESESQKIRNIQSQISKKSEQLIRLDEKTKEERAKKMSDILKYENELARLNNKEYKREQTDAQNANRIKNLKRKIKSASVDAAATAPAPATSWVSTLTGGLL